LPLKRAYNKLHYLGKALARRKLIKNSRHLFERVLSSKYLDQKEEAQFDIIWGYISEKNISEAITFIKKEKLIENFNKIEDPKLMFWVSHVLSHKEKEVALKLHSHL